MRPTRWWCCATTATRPTGAFDLEPGTYLLPCNIRAEHYDGEMRAHFEQGMYTVLTVS